MTPSVTPTPIPALAPVESPELLLGDADGEDEDVGVAEAEADAGVEDEEVASAAPMVIRLATVETSTYVVESAYSQAASPPYWYIAPSGSGSVSAEGSVEFDSLLTMLRTFEAAGTSLYAKEEPSWSYKNIVTRTPAQRRSIVISSAMVTLAGLSPGSVQLFISLQQIKFDAMAVIYLPGSPNTYTRYPARYNLFQHSRFSAPGS